ncbi:MAG: NAD-dependent epimerase/dehydratase family protein [Bacteroidota bacterium]
MKKALLTGGTGMVGSLILKRCLADPEIGEVVTFGRKPSGVTHPKLTEVIHQDFTDFSGLEAHFQAVDIAFHCLGVYTGSVSRELFRKITVDFTREFAEMVYAHSPESMFCLLSGAGADRTEQSRMAFAKDKGISENHLLALGFKQAISFRPGYIYPVEPRDEPNFSYRLFRWLYPLLKGLMAKTSITSEELAQAMFVAGKQGAPQEVLENIGIKALLT